MATFFRNKIINELGTTRTRLIESQPASRITVIGFSLCNLTTATVRVSVLIEDASSVMGYYIKDITLPPYQSARIVNGGEKLVLAENNAIYAESDTDNAVDVIVSYVELV